MSHVAKIIDELDAAVFSGELLWIDDERELLKQHLARWQRAVEQHEANPVDGDGSC